MKKAISPLISAIFLIAITLTIAFVITNWTREFSKSQTEIIKEKGESKIECSQASLVIDTVSYNCTAAKFSLEAYNSGSKNLENFKFQILLKNTSSYILRTTDTILYPGDTGTFYNSSLNITFSELDRLIFTSETCPFQARNVEESSRITSYGCT